MKSSNIQNVSGYSANTLSDTFEVVFDIQEDVGLQILKCLCKHYWKTPFITEFAQKHKGLPHLSCVKQKDQIIVAIKDNGKGMSEVALRKIRTRLEKGFELSGTNIGIKNVDQRMKIIFGDKYGLKINSAENTGTEIIMLFPTYRR